MVGDLFVALDIDKSGCLKEVAEGASSAASFMARVDEHICKRDHRLYEEGLSSKDTLSLYKTFNKEVGCKQYLHGVGDAGSRLLCKFRSGTHGLMKSWVGIEVEKGR